MVTLVWSSEAVFRSFQRRSGQGQVKKGQIFKFINVDQKGIYLDQFWLRNLMVSFVFAYDPQKLQKSQWKKNDVINRYDFGDENTLFGVKNWAINPKFCTMVDD